MNSLVNPIKSIALMRRVQQALSLAKNGKKDAATAVSCATCGKFDKAKPMLRGNQEVWLWCGQCRDFSPVDAEALARCTKERERSK